MDSRKPHARRSRAWPAAVVLGLALASHVRASAQDYRDWIATWTAAPHRPLTIAQFENQTLRQIAHVSLGGSSVRVRFSNEFGTAPVVLGAAHLALQSPDSPESILPDSDRVLTFGGRTSAAIPPGAPLLSDPIELDVPPLANLVISIYLPGPTPGSTVHALNSQDTYVSPPGDFTGAVRFPVATTRRAWHFLSGVNVDPRLWSATIVVAGDSIAEGFGSTPNTNQRWPNLLAQRLQLGFLTRRLAVVIQGIGDNSTLRDSLGANALARFDRDVLTVPGARFAIVHAGINNLFADDSVEDMIGAYRQLIARGHTARLRVYGGTLTPFEGYMAWTPEREAKRQAVNAWIRNSREWDAVIDFDLAVRDPEAHSRLFPVFDSGDHLHPNDIGAQALADAIDPRLFRDR